MQIYANSHAIEQACKTLPDQSLKMLFQQREHPAGDDMATRLVASDEDEKRLADDRRQCARSDPAIT